MRCFRKMYDDVRSTACGSVDTTLQWRYDTDDVYEVTCRVCMGTLYYMRAKDNADQLLK